MADRRGGPAPSCPLKMHHYAIAIGSNRANGRHIRPQAVVAAAIAALDQHSIAVIRQAPVVTSRPIGPSRRSYANTAVLVETTLPPLDLLRLLKRVERAFGRRRGQRWAARTLDLDIILWSGGTYHSRTLSIPHAGMAERAFVLSPLNAIGPDWRAGTNGQRVRHLNYIVSHRPTPQSPVDPRGTSA